MKLAKKLFLIIIFAITLFTLFACRKPKYDTALKIRVQDLPRNLFPYESIKPANTFVTSFIYDTLLSNHSIPSDYVEGKKYLFPNNEEYKPIDSKTNYFQLENNLLEYEGAYPKKDSSKYGFIKFNPTNEEFNQQLKKRKITKGFDPSGAKLNETDSEFLIRREKEVPAKNWHKYLFKVRDGYTWNDGVKFSAHDIEFTFKYALKYTGQMANIAFFLSTLFDVKALNDTDLEIRLATNKISDIKLITTSIYIIPKHIWENIEKPRNQKNMSPVGTGPYYVHDYILDSSMILKYRDNYDKKLEKEEFAYSPIQEIFLNRIESQEVMLNALEKNEFDISLESIPTTKALGIEREKIYKNIKISKIESNFITTLALNVGKKGIFSKLNNSLQVRKAISLSIDQEKLIKEMLYNNGSTVGDGLVEKRYPHALRDSSNNYVEHKFDVLRANKILDDSGYKINDSGYRDLSFKIFGPIGYEPHIKAISKMISDNLKIKVDFKLADSSYSEDIKQKNGKADFDMIINSVTFAPDKLLMFDARFGVYPNKTPRTWNMTGIVDDSLSKLMFEMDVETDINKQYKKSMIVQEKIKDLYLEIPLYVGMNYFVYQNNNFDNFIDAKNESILNKYTFKYLKRK